MKIFLRLVALLSLFFVSFPLQAQLTVNSTPTPQQLVQNVLVGNGVTVSNVQFTGSISARGSFTANGTNLGITSGVILSTGNITDAIGPNNIGSKGIDLMQLGDANLDNITYPDLTQDAAVLEFDFVPTSDTVQFRYVFGSEEYLEFVNLGYNDVFAFFISGPGISGQQNIALVPGTSTPVSIDNVNNLVNAAHYVDNGTGMTPSANPWIQYDGFTKVLVAKAAVQCGMTYHLKLAIADVGDGIYDSGVFLEAGSFSAIGGYTLSSQVDFGGNDTVLYEGCGTAMISVTRQGSVNQPATVNYTVTGTATNGVDINNLSGVINFPAGVSVVTIPITAVADGIPDNNETLTISINTVICNNPINESITLLIAEPAPITVDIGPDRSFTCQETGTNIALQAVVTGGIQPYSYQWSTGSTSSTINAPAGAGTYYVGVTDVCTTSVAADTVVFSVVGAQPINLTVNNDTIVCPGSSVQLVGVATGGNGGITYQWNTGSTNSTTTTTPTVPRTYILTVSDNCGITAIDSVRIDLHQIIADFSWMAMDDDGLIQFTDESSSSGNIITWNWDFDDGNNSNEQHPLYDYVQPGDYDVVLSIKDDNGCLADIKKRITVYTQTFIYIPNTFTPNRDGINEIFNMVGTGFRDFEMSIFDRWGQVVYHTRNYKIGWNGMRPNQQDYLPMGVYVYRIDLIDGAGLNQTYRGHVNLIR